MIGVIVDRSQHPVVREFFELFKTPWEFYTPMREYDVVICTGDQKLSPDAKLVITYVATAPSASTGHVRSSHGDRIPIYTGSATFPEQQQNLLIDERSQQCAGYLDRSGSQTVARVGYNLFAEIQFLFETGQPEAFAGAPAIELHIAFLRQLITDSGIQLTEIPPVPDGYTFIACLTHDVDHPSIRQHGWDHTVLGFLSRAVLGSARNFLRRRLAFQSLLKNWLAALKLPFVQLGFAKDFWRDFDERYLKLEAGLHSTFFVIPSRDYPGKKNGAAKKDGGGSAPAFRAAKYGAEEIADKIQKLLAAGCEVGLHGIDAWFDASSASGELNKVRSVTGATEIGVRMHWLYYDEASPLALEKAGAAYDSTVGYNNTVGYRAGTTQAYKPLNTAQLLELPLHIMDTALFYPTHLGLSAPQAAKTLDQMVDNAARFGGCLTVNWHDRSLAPERLWGATYCDLLEELKRRGAWFATAGEAVAWFRERRSVVFESDSTRIGTVQTNQEFNRVRQLPRLRLRVYNGGETADLDQRYVDIPFVHSDRLHKPSEVSV